MFGGVTKAAIPRAKPVTAARPALSLKSGYERGLCANPDINPSPRPLPPLGLNRSPLSPGGAALAPGLLITPERRLERRGLGIVSRASKI